MEDILKQLLSEFNEYFDSLSEYGIGYLDSLTEICQKYDIKHKRTYDNLYIGVEV